MYVGPLLTSRGRKGTDVGTALLEHAAGAREKARESVVRLAAMDVFLRLFVGLHIIGIAALLGGALTQLPPLARAGQPVRMVPAMLYGALTMLATGVILLGLAQAQHVHINLIKIGLKLAVLVVILGLVYVKRDEDNVDRSLVATVGGLTAVNIFIAVLWT